MVGGRGVGGWKVEKREGVEGGGRGKRGGGKG